MYKKIGLLLVLLTCFSCYTAKYTTSTGAEGNVDFTQGRWILNEATCLNCDEELLEDKLMEFLKGCIKDSVVGINEERQRKLISSKIPFEPSKTQLKTMAEGTDANYLITVQGKIIKNEFGYMGYESDVPYTDDENIAEVSIAFYDIKTQTQIHYINTRGVVSVSKSENDDDGDFVFATDAFSILRKSMKKNIKKIKRNCRCY